MDEKRPQPAWKKDGQQQQQQQQHSSRDHRSWNKGQRRDDRDKGRRPDSPPPERKAPIVGPLEVEVYNNDVGQALKVLKNKMSKDGILAELKRRKHAEKPSEAKRRKHREALKRLRKSKGKSHRSGGWKRPDRSRVAESRPMPDYPLRDSAASEIPPCAENDKTLNDNKDNSK